MTQSLIEFRNVHKTLGSTYVLRGTNLQIPKGKITTIIGKSGTGKSVFFKHIIGLLKPDAIVIAEHFRKQPSPGTAGELTLEREARYGDTVLAFYKK